MEAQIMSGGKSSSFLSLTLIFITSEIFIYVGIGMAQTHGALTGNFVLQFLYIAPFAIYVIDTVEMFTGKPFKITVRRIYKHFAPDPENNKIESGKVPDPAPVEKAPL